MQKQILIEELFELANKTVTENIEKINDLRPKYISYLSRNLDNKDYKQYLDELYLNKEIRAYACILIYNYHFDKEEFGECNNYFYEMENLQENMEVVKFLFKIYGRNLHIIDVRVKLLRLCKENPQLEQINQLRFYYFNFMAESYNGNFEYGRNYLSNIKSRYHNLNPEFHNEWKNNNNEILVFDAIVLKTSGEKYKAVKIKSLQQTIRLKKGEYNKLALHQSVKVKLHFYLYGLMAEIL